MWTMYNTYQFHNFWRLWYVVDSKKSQLDLMSWNVFQSLV